MIRFTSPHLEISEILTGMGTLRRARVFVLQWCRMTDFQRRVLMLSRAMRGPGILCLTTRLVNHKSIEGEWYSILCSCLDV